MWDFKRRWRSSDSWSSTKLPLAILLPPARKQGSWRERNTKPVYYCFVQMFYGGSAVRRNLRCTRYTKARVPLKCCKVFNIFGSVRVAPRRLKSSSSHHWPNCLQRWIRNWGVKSRTSCFGSFVNIYPDRGDRTTKIRDPRSVIEYYFTSSLRLPKWLSNHAFLRKFSYLDIICWTIKFLSYTV